MASGERFGKYVLLNKIADGGMAEVFLAVVESLGGFQKRVALKKILPSFSRDESFVHSFVNEARICGQLHHPNVVQVYGFDRIDDYLCLAMEFIEGLDLERIITHRLLQRKLIPPSIAAEIVLQMLEGLEYAHTATNMEDQPLNIVHRDLKPSNILIDRSGVIKIVDFGVAKASTNLYKTMNVGTAKGTVSYMSPEQASGRLDLGPASDVFGVGSILYELLTLRRLFDGDNLFMILDEVRSAPLDAHFAKIPSEVPKALVDVLHKALARDLGRRYLSAAEMARDIRVVFPDLQGPALLARFVEELRADGLSIAGVSEPGTESAVATAEAAPETRADVPAGGEGDGRGAAGGLGSFDLALLGVSTPGEAVGAGRKRDVLNLSSGRERGVPIRIEDLATVPAESSAEPASGRASPGRPRERRPSPASVLRSSSIESEQAGVLADDEPTPVEHRRDRSPPPRPAPAALDDGEVTPVTREREEAPQAPAPVVRMAGSQPPVAAGKPVITGGAAPLDGAAGPPSRPAWDTDAGETAARRPGRLESRPEIDLEAGLGTGGYDVAGETAAPRSESAVAPVPGALADMESPAVSPPAPFVVPGGGGLLGAGQHQEPQDPGVVQPDVQPVDDWDNLETEALPPPAEEALHDAVDWLSSQPMIGVGDGAGGGEAGRAVEPLPRPLPNTQVESLLDQPPGWAEEEEERPFGAPLERVVPEPNVRAARDRVQRVRRLRALRTVLSVVALVCVGAAAWTFFGMEPSIREILFPPAATRVTFLVVDPPLWGDPLFLGDPAVVQVSRGVFQVRLARKAAYEMKIVGPTAESVETYTVVIDPDDPATWRIARHFTRRPR